MYGREAFGIVDAFEVEKHTVVEGEGFAVVPCFDCGRGAVPVRVVGAGPSSLQLQVRLTGGVAFGRRRQGKSRISDDQGRDWQRARPTLLLVNQRFVDSGLEGKCVSGVREQKRETGLTLICELERLDMVWR